MCTICRPCRRASSGVYSLFTVEAFIYCTTRRVDVIYVVVPTACFC